MTDMGAFFVLLKQFFGTKAFYRRILMLTLPIMVQNGITNFVNMLDNVMVGQVGTVPMTGVAVSNQLMFVFNLCVFGAVSGAGIFGAQFYGKGDHSGLRYSLRFKIVFCSTITLLGIGLFVTFGSELIQLYLRGEGNPEDAAASLQYARGYLLIMLIGMLPYTLAQCYASTLRETGQTVVPMVAGLVAVFLNLGLNYVLIFGKFGLPVMGVSGAAIATVIARFAELAIVALWTHLRPTQNVFAVGLFRSLKVPKALFGSIFVKSLPLMLNETLWAAGLAATNQCYSIKGISVVAATNISTTFYNVFSVAFLSVGMAIGILLGQQLGAGEQHKAKDTARKAITFSVLVSLVVAAVYAMLAEILPNAYNTTDEVRHLAVGFMQIAALAMPLEAYVNAAYFTLRSGGKTITTILFDSCFMWGVVVVVAHCLSNYTMLPVLTIYFICQFLALIKCIIGGTLVHRGVWIKNLVA